MPNFLNYNLYQHEKNEAHQKFEMQQKSVLKLKKKRCMNANQELQTLLV